ncbi:hypothetical protein SAMN04487995_6019 [Dyadobacter koreensis]|uniref:Uncharacterized protein n=1 Tax=Dyadobacter koreensis TaxID=408657 RepID=A0A1H7B946_9BACT|nr:hypothetical protein SAMN04487995_6019 [Dyadobacter koreensis]
MKKIKLNLDDLKVESFMTSLSNSDLNQRGGDGGYTSLVSASVVSATVSWALSCDEYTCNLTQHCVTTACPTIKYTGCDGDCTLVC